MIMEPMLISDLFHLGKRLDFLAMAPIPHSEDQDNLTMERLHLHLMSKPLRLCSPFPAMV